MSGCTGRCCRAFTIDLDALTRPDTAENIDQGDYIRDMLVALEPQEDGFWSCTCRHFDAGSGRCRAYEQRPRMCSRFPYGRPCPYPECEMPLEEQLATEPVTLPDGVRDPSSSPRPAAER